MNLQQYDIIALTAETQAIHKEIQQPIILRHGQVDTIIMNFYRPGYFVNIADIRGNTYAMETVPAAKLMQLDRTLGINTQKAIAPANLQTHQSKAWEQPVDS